MISRRRWLIALLLAGTVLPGLYLTRGRILPALAAWLDTGIDPQHADEDYDYILVLGGEADVRPFFGAALYKAGLARKVLLTEVKAHADVECSFAPPLHEVDRQVLLEQGVPPEAIQIIGGQCESTMDEARALAEVLEAAPETRVLAVTSDYHTRRSRWTFRQVLGARAEQVSFFSAPTRRIPLDSWWQHEEGFLAITGEYLKLALYGLRYGRLMHWGVGIVMGSAGGILLWRRCRARSASRQRLGPQGSARVEGLGRS
jgi:uncharacterized SAM-binding protein YcdF (DUF218 family)